MKKIVFLGGDFNRSGGTERVASIIANGLAERGHEVVVASVHCGDRPFYPLHESIRVRSLFETAGRNLTRAPVLVARLRRMLIEERADALIAVESMLALFTVPATVGLRTQHICWEHFHFKNDLGRLGRRIARQLAARFCDDVVTLTERDRSFWEKGTKLKAAIHAIPNPSPFPVQDSDAPTDGRLVLSVGRLVQIKGFDLLLDAWRRVILAEPTWRLRIVGSGPDGDQLKVRCLEYGMSETVEFVEATPDIKRHYGEAAIYCLSSRLEGFPMVLVEALSFGIPVVSFDCDTGPAEILDGTGALLVADGDTSELADSLIEFIKDPIRRGQVSSAEKRRAKEFQPERIIDRWSQLLSS
jgi:glycosyltransferase involved in cell wall biosynthesis